MSTTTTNYSLIKPELTDAADITAMNENWDIIDTELKSRATLVNDKIPVEQLPNDEYAPFGLTNQTFSIRTNDELTNALNQAVNSLKLESTGFFLLEVNTEGLSLGGGTWQLNVCRQRNEYASVIATSYDVGGKVRVMYISKYNNVWGTWTNGVGNVSTATVG